MGKNETINLLPGDYLFREGDFDKTAFIIESGAIELLKNTGDKQVVLAEVGKGALFGEMAVIDNSARSASARAKSACVLTVIDETKLKSYLSSSPTVALDMMRRLSSYARSANEKLSTDPFSNENNIAGVNSLNSPKPLNTDINTAKTLKEFNDDLDDFARISPSRPLAFSGITILALTVIFMIWASITQLDVTVSTRGKILTSIPNVLAQANYSSVLKTLLVKEGDSIEEGQPIAEFDATFTASDYRNSERELLSLNQDLDRLMAERALVLDQPYRIPRSELQAELFAGFSDDYKKETKTRLNEIVELGIAKKRAEIERKRLRDKVLIDLKLTNESLQRKLAVKKQFLIHIKGGMEKTSLDPRDQEYFLSLISKFDAEVSEINQKLNYQMKAVERSTKLQRANVVSDTEFEADVLELEKNKVSKKKFSSAIMLTTLEEIETLEDSLIENQRQQRESNLDLDEVEIRLAEIRLQIETGELNNQRYTNNLLTEKNLEIKGILQKKQVIEEKLIKLKRQLEDVRLRSPVDGTVLKLEEKFDGSVINTGDTIATIVPTDVNYHVEVDIDPADITHVYEGAKVKLSLDALPSQKHGELVGEVSMISKDTIDQNVFGENTSGYRATIQILENNLTELPDGFKLLPSMNVTGNIISGKRSVMTFLMFPVIKTLETSFREP